MVRRVELRTICDACGGAAIEMPKPPILVFENQKFVYDLCERDRDKFLQALGRFVPGLSGVELEPLKPPEIVDTPRKLDARGRRTASPRQCPYCERVVDARNIARHMRGHQAQPTTKTTEVAK